MTSDARASPTLSALTSPEDQGATFVELFFDLVFVFAVTQVTHYAAAHLELVGILRAVLVFWLVWWAWTQFTWALNAADTDHHQVRLGTLVSTAVAFVMAASVERAFGAGTGAVWFAAPYVAVRLLGLGLYHRVAGTPEQRSAVRVFGLASLPGLAVVLAGALVAPDLRGWLWLGAIVLDVAAAAVGGRRVGWDLHPEHFAERHGLIVIIALGESLIIAGAAVAGEARTGALVVVGATAVAATCLLWWSYFGWVKDALEAALAAVSEADRAPLARDAYSLWHFPLVCGIIAYAVGVEGLLAHPEATVSTGVGAALGAGVLLFVVSTAGALWRATGELLPRRLGILLLTLAALAGLLAAVPGAPGAWLLVLVGVGLAVINLAEHRRCIRGAEPG